jgi:protein-L-isoaspartate(D-aspartate) O-methyltransferase
MRRVPREAFVPETLQEFAYQDTPLPIEHQQTISQPYIVALMIEALDLQSGARVLEVGTGSGYAAAVLAELAAEVYTIERYSELADLARERLRRAGYGNVQVMHGDGTRGWAEHAPYDAIVVAAGGPDAPRSLLDQLAPGGRLVIPVGPTQHTQELIRITRKRDGGYHSERLTQVRFVPLVGEEGWNERERAPQARPSPPAELPDHIRQVAEPILFSGQLRWAGASEPSSSLESLLGRIGDARVVCIGEATHGTSEFYRMRERITRALIEQKGFDIVAVEADWPDAARIDHHVRDLRTPPGEWRAFSRFPTWMWRNQEVREFVDWLRAYNGDRAEGERVGFYGLDLYSMYTSIHEVLRYLDAEDPESARVARARYGCLTPWESDPATYGRAVLSGHYRDCEVEVVAILSDLLTKRMGQDMNDGERFMQAVQNARLVVNAERYYRVMYYGSRQSWNLRDSHMFETLKMLLAFRAPGSRAVVWEHNSHVGDARATAMAARGEHNVGQLVRQQFGQDAYLIGFGTHSGTVAAASDWDSPMEVMTVRPSHERSYERQCHDSGVAAFCLPMRPRNTLRERLLAPRLERAIGVIYRPETELASHYFDAVLPRQFDEYIWFDTTRAVTPLDSALLQDVPDTYPFGL